MSGGAGAADVAAGGNRLARLRIALLYLWRHGRRPDFERALRFTELVQRRKLVCRNVAYARLQDKVAVKNHVAATIGADWVTPTLWSGRDLPAAPLWQAPFVVKARHGCGQTIFVRHGMAGWPAIRRRAHGWLRRSYGGWLDEWLYSRIERGLLVEPFIGSDGTLPVDYKFYVFGGRVAAVQVHERREQAHRWMLLDPAWRRLSATGDWAAGVVPPRPASLAVMVAAAARLGAGIDFVRVDLYDINGAPRFGEMTFYPGSGLDPFETDAIDLWLSALWRAASEAEHQPGERGGHQVRQAAGDQRLDAEPRDHRPLVGGKIAGDRHLDGDRTEIGKAA